MEGRRLGDIATSETGVAPPKDAYAALIAEHVDERQRHRRAALLVLGLETSQDFLDEFGVGPRKKGVAFIEASFGASFKAWGINVESPDHVKLPQIGGLYPRVEREVHEALEQLRGLESVNSGRNAVQKSIGKYRPLLTALMPQPLFKARVSELFDAVARVAASDALDLLPAHARAKELIDGFEGDLDAHPPLGRRLLGPIAGRLSALCDEAYRLSPATQPALMSAAAAPKKYPLHDIDQQLRLSIRIENRGAGQALDARIENLLAEGVDLGANTLPIGQVMPGTINVSLPARPGTGWSGSALVVGTLMWVDSDGSLQESDVELEFLAQRSDVDWTRLRQPYDLEPVSTQEDLVGRSEVLRELQDLIGPRKVGSAFVTGQKRVGKTSVALTLRSAMSSETDVAVVYLEAGLFVQPSAAATISGMGRDLAAELLACDERFRDTPAEDFEGTLAPLRHLVGRLRQRVPKLRVLFVVDEFDELPVELYRRGPVGDAFFLAIRALAGQEHIGFVLVGGEKMNAVIDAQGEDLNKFETVTVDYFDRQRHWDDFCDLVRVPVSDCLEVSDEAVVRLFEFTAGHPYFTKLIARSIFKLAVGRRDAHVTSVEVEQAAREALSSASAVNFIHFWEDGILDFGEAVEDVSVRRRKLLLAYAETAETGDRSTVAVVEAASNYGLDPNVARDLVREFVRRGILCEFEQTLVAKVPLFDLWLREYGVHAITTTFTDPDAVLNAKRRAREQSVKPQEILDLTSRWGHYRGSAVTPEHVRAWLSQFESIRAQRLMFNLLTGVRFYDAGLIREKLREAHATARRGLVHKLGTGKITKRDDMVVSYLGDVGKSGARYARLYADENNIYSDKVVERGQLTQSLSEDGVQALVLVDDMIGSGQQACEFLELLEHDVGNLIRKREIKVIFATVAGFDHGVSVVEEAVARLELDVTTHVSDVFGAEHRAFSPEAPMWGSAGEREEARGLAESYGRRLQRKSPLGYNEVQALVVFDESCPNGTLPILWDSADGWMPLFPRHKGR